MKGGDDRRLDDAVGVEVFRAHVELDISVQEVDAPGFRKLRGMDPPPEALERQGVERGLEVLLRKKWMLSGHDEFYLLKSVKGTTGFRGSWYT
jgi:hypothetical protein